MGAAAGVWRSELAGALIYGLAIVSIDLIFSIWRMRAARARRGRLAGFLAATFLVRLLLIMAGVGAAFRIFERTGCLTVCFVLLLIVPAGIIAAATMRAREG